MRNGIWRETDRHLVIESRRYRSYYKQCNRAFPVCGIFLWRAKNLLESHSPRLRLFRDSTNRLWGTLHFSTLSTNNECLIKGKASESISTIIIIAPFQQSIQEWTLNLNWTDKKVKTKTLLGCFEIIKFNVLDFGTRFFPPLVTHL